MSPSDSGGSKSDQSATGQPAQGISPPSGHIPEVTTAKPLTAAVALSTLVILGMIGLYVLLIGAWGFLTVRFMLTLPDRISRYGVVGTIFLIAVAAIAVMVLLFLVKPLIPLPRGRSKPTEVTEQDQPELFAYIDALADCTDTPRPERILIDVDANASASFQGGLFGAIGGRLTLTLGLPLAGALTVRQFAGIVAHELGHFSQGHMIRQNALTHFVSGWLTEVALEEDIFDRLVSRLADTLPSFFALPFRIVRLITYSVRRLLFGVMIVGHATSRLVSRQLEYDADQFMVHTAGSDHFAETMNQTIMLAHASAMTLDEVSRIYQDRRLPTNLPAMIVARARRITPEQRSKMLKGHARSERESFSTHPLTRKRVAAAEALNSKGLVQDDRPAHMLFRNFAELCTKSSEDLYKNVIGEKYEPKHLTDSSLLISELDATDKARQAALRYCQSELLLAHPMFPPKTALKLPHDPKAALLEIGKLRTEALKLRTRAIPLIRKHAEAYERLMNSRRGMTIVQAGFEINNYAALGLGAGDRHGLTEEIATYSAEVDRYTMDMRSANRALVRRVELAMGLLQHEKVGKALSERRCERMRNEVRKLIPAGNALASVRNAIDDLKVHASTLHLGLSMCAQGAVSQELISRTLREAQDTRGIISDVLRILHADAYPFAHGDGNVSIAAALCQRPPDGDNPADIYFVSEEMIGRYEDIRVRVVGRLCYLAERVEKAMGLKPLPDPEEDDALDELMSKIGMDSEQPDPGAGKILADAIPLFGHGLAGVSVLVIAGAALFLFGGVSLGSDDSPASDRNRPRNRTTVSTPATPPPTIEHDRPSTTRPQRTRPDSSRPDIDRPRPVLNIESAIAQLGSRDSDDQQEAADYLLGQQLSEAQKQRVLSQLQPLVLQAYDELTHRIALQLLDEFSQDQGFAFITEYAPSARSNNHEKLIGHLSRRPPEELAPVLIGWLGSPIGDAAAKELADPRYHALIEPGLIERLSDRNDRARAAAIKLLETVATEAAIPALELAMNDADLSVRSTAERILKKISPMSVDDVAKFLRLAASTDPSSSSLFGELARLASIDGRDDPRRREVCTQLVRIIEAGRSSNQTHAWRALINWADTPALGLCEPILKSERSPRDQVKAALNVVATQQTAEAAEMIIPWMLLETVAVREALIQNGPSSELAVLEYLTHDNADVRLACCDILAEVGGRPSLQPLNRRGGDRDPRVERAAREAFYAIRDRLAQAEPAGNP